MMEPRGSTIGDALRSATAMLREAGVESPSLEAQLLVAHALGVNRLGILAHIETTLSPEPQGAIFRLVSRRCAREPLAYLRGVQEFYGLEFEVGPAVLVPRPETELLVDAVRSELSGVPASMLVDAGTGSGCIAIAAAVALPDIRVLAIDLSDQALNIARANAEKHGVRDRVVFRRQDILSGELPPGVDMIVSNPPYIPSDEIAGLQPEVRSHEPRTALDGGPDGLTFHRELARLAAVSLKPGGAIALEVGAGQACAAADILQHHRFAGVAAVRDLQTIERVVVARRPF